ncbi:hypothetical protein D3C74_336590 [compost metagenome]
MSGRNGLRVRACPAETVWNSWSAGCLRRIRTSSILSPGLGRSRMSAFCRKICLMSRRMREKNRRLLMFRSRSHGLRSRSCGFLYLRSWLKRGGLRFQQMPSQRMQSCNGPGRRMPSTYGYSFFTRRLGFRSLPRTARAGQTSASG